MPRLCAMAMTARVMATSSLECATSRTREALQISERGISGAEVIDGETNTHPAQSLQFHHHFVRVLHHHALGDLQLQILRIESGGFQDRGELGHEILLAKLSR